VSTPQKRFPKAGGESEPKQDADDYSVDDPGSTRSSKVRGGIEVLHIKSDDTFDPYQRQPDDRKADGGKRDLRKLSEHIKMMRELEERRKKGDD
jgi:hypothetical protein